MADNKELQYHKDIDWNDVFRIWREQEQDPLAFERWREHFQYEGFESWEDWRETWSAPWGLYKRAWSLHEVLDPLTTIPTWFAGPFKELQMIHPEDEEISFAELAREERVQEDEKITDIAEQFPPLTVLMAVTDGERYKIIDGTARACAIARLARTKKKLRSKVLVMVTEIEPMEFETDFRFFPATYDFDQEDEGNNDDY